jgi:hypothetical protein
VVEHHEGRLPLGPGRLAQKSLGYPRLIALLVPQTETEIVTAAGRPMGIVESMSSPAKLKLPGQNRDPAIDVAAMVNEGGILIYGVGEEANKRTTLLRPRLPRARPAVATARSTRGTPPPSSGGR